MRHRLALVGALVALSAACEPWYNRVPSPDDALRAIPWFDHMVRQRSVHPYQFATVPRLTVPGTVPITGSEGDWETEFRSGNSATADRLANPYAAGGSDSSKAPGPDVALLPGTLAAKGDTLYGFFCTVCHGEGGDGRGPVGPRVNAPSLLTARARAFSDGYLYSIIRYGRGVMPRYGDKVYRPADRWAIVAHVRTLQGASAEPVAPAATPTPAAAAPGAP